MSDALNEAESLAEPFEGFRSRPYQDSVGVWTIGIGSTRDAAGQPVTAFTQPITLDEARALVRRDMTRALQAVEGDVRVPLSVDQTAALVDFIYNLGSGAFAGSTLLRKLNAGDYAGAAAEFDKWDHAGGNVLAGLARRRAAERALFAKS